MRTIQFKRFDFDILVKQRPEFDADGELLRSRKGTLAVESGIVSDGDIFHLKRRREETQVHLAQRDLPPQALLELCLNLVVIAVDVNQVGHNQSCCNQQHYNDQNRNSQFAHTSATFPKEFNFPIISWRRSPLVDWNHPVSRWLHD